MKTQRGIALIATLLIMFAILALGLGSMFLTDTNLRIAENARSSVIAKGHADAGIDTAVALLTRAYKINGRYPPPGWSLPVTANQSYELLEYTPIGTSRNQARIRVEGILPNNARYISEALLTTTSPINPAFEIGMSSMGTVRITGGGSAEFINAGVHGNTGVELPGYNTNRFRSCPLGVTWENCPVVFNPANYNSTTYNRYSNNNPTNPAVPRTFLPVSSSNGTGCYMTPWCGNMETPIEINVDYIRKRNDEIAIALGFVDPEKTKPDGSPLPLYYQVPSGQLDEYNEPIMIPASDGRGGWLYADPDVLPPRPPVSVNWEDTGNTNIYDGRCTVVYTDSNPPPATITSVADGAVICARGSTNHSLNFASGINMNGVTVIADGNITFSGASPCTGAAVGQTGACRAGNLTDTKLISRNKIGVAANATGVATFGGRGGVMIDHVTGHNLTIFTGANRFHQNGNPLNYVIGGGFNLTGNTTIASTRDITFSGQTQVTTYPSDPTKGPEVTVVIISNGSITNSGSSDFYGVFWARTGFDQSGTGKIYGAVVSEGDITSNGKFHINSTYALNNSTLFGSATSTVASRR